MLADATKQILTAVEVLEEAQDLRAEALAHLKRVMAKPNVSDAELIDALSLCLDRAKQTQVAFVGLDLARMAAKRAWANRTEESRRG
jgi:hypothetical protein